jgi:ADP-heptose:LPS heptosyltransferase
LLMTGLHPTPLPMLPSLACALSQNLVERRFVLMVPGSSPRHPAKRWPARRYGVLAAALRRAGYASVIIGSAVERAVADAIRENCPEAIDLMGQTDIATVAALAERAELAIGNDTGVMHLAAAADCPVVVLFSAASDPALCGPRGRLVRVLAVGNLAELEVDRVLAEALGTIAQRTQGATAPAPTMVASENPG